MSKYRRYKLADDIEVNANIYLAKAMLWIILPVIAILLANELGFFRVYKPVMRVCAAISVVLMALPYIISKTELIKRRNTKYYILESSIILSWLLIVFLNFHALLVIFFPFLIASIYRTRQMTKVATVNAILIAITAPICGIFFNTWQVEYFEFLIFASTHGNWRTVAEGTTDPQAFTQTLLYVCLPMVFIIIVIQIIQMTSSKVRRDEFSHRDQLKRQVASKDYQIRENAEKLALFSSEMVEAFVEAVDAKDDYTAGHSHRVSEISMKLASAIGLSDDDMIKLRYASLMHDIGKMAIPDDILKKPGRLTSEEYEIIKTHTTRGYDILSHSSNFTEIAEIARNHHERWDGKGYPDGLQGENIPYLARIVALADSYDAMTSSRVYRPKLSHDKVRSELVNGRGTQWDPDMTDIFLQLFDGDILEDTNQATE